MPLKLTIFRKGLILVAVPLLFQLALIGVIADMQRHAVEAGNDVARTKEVLARVETVLTKLVDLETASRGFAITKNHVFTEPYDVARKDVPPAIEQLKVLVSDNPPQQARVEELAVKATHFIEWHTARVREVEAGDKEKAQARIGSLEGKHQMDAMRSDIAAFRLEEERLDAERTLHRDQTRQTLHGILIGGAVAAVALTLLLAFLFSRGIGGRLAVLRDNARHLAEGKELLAPVSGTDEINEVDQAFREMAQALTRSQGELRTSEANHRTIFESAADGIFIADPTGRIVDVNSSGCAMMGYTRDELLARTINDIVAEEERPRLAPLIGRLLAGEAVKSEWLYRRKDGTCFPGEVSTVMLPNGRFIGIARDLSERKRAEDTIRLYADIVKSVPFGLMVYRLDDPSDNRSLRIVDVNPSASALIGMEAQVLLGKNILEAFPAVTPELLRVYADVVRTGTAVEIGEIYYGDEHLKHNYWSIKAFPLPDQRVGLAFENISARKQAEEALRRLNEELEHRVEERTAELRKNQEALEIIRRRLDLTLSSAGEGIFGLDLDGRTTFANPAGAHMLGWEIEELLGKPQHALIHHTHPDGSPYPREDCPIYRAFVDGDVHRRDDEVFWRKDGSSFPVEYISSPIREDGRVTGAVVVFRDITERKQIESTIRAREAQFRGLLEAAPDAIVIIDGEGEIVLINAQAERLFGYKREELLDRAVEVLLPERLRSQHVSHRLAYFEDPHPRGMGSGLELFGRHKDGTEIPIEISLSPLETESGILAMAAVRDITERKLAEERLQQQLARVHLINQITQSIGERQDLHSIYRVVLAQLEQNLPLDLNAICSFDPATNRLSVEAVGPKSKPLHAELGLDEQAVFPVDANRLGACVRGETLYDPDLTRVDAPLPQKLAKAGLRSLAAAPLGMGGKTFGILLTARRAANGYSSPDCEFLKQLSNHVFLAVQHAQLYQELKTAYDDLRQSQKAMLQQERLRALGQMASGIAHDINNAISPIAIYAESLLENEPTLTPRARDYLTTIAQAIDDVANTVSRMRDFYRQQEKQVALEPVNLNPLVQQVVTLTRAKWRDQTQERGITIDLQTELTPDLPVVMGVESEIRDALTNLVFNAVDAMPRGGTLTIQTRRGTRLEEEDGGQSDATHVIVEVGDTGIGMDEDTRQRCLEPFFTTKGERGTGLGLAMVYGTMQRHSGDIDIESAPDKGTRVRLLFLMPQEVLDERGREEATPGKIDPLRILVVDDDALVRKSLQAILQADGHLVTTADGGQAGIEAFRVAHDRGKPFQLVITDLGMPYVDGRAVAQAVKEKAPTTPVILLTGWGQRMKTEGDLPAHVNRVLAKPPKMKELRGALAALAERITP